MQLYHWQSTGLAEWTLGDILVVAPSLEAARDTARSHVEQWLRDEKEWLFLPGEEANLAAEIAKFHYDIKQEPSVTGIVFIRGSS